MPAYYQSSWQGQNNSLVPIIYSAGLPPLAEPNRPLNYKVSRALRLSLRLKCKQRVFMRKKRREGIARRQVFVVHVPSNLAYSILDVAQVSYWNRLESSDFRLDTRLGSLLYKA